MKSSRRFFGWAAVVIASAASEASASPPVADWVLTGGSIFTSDAGNPWAEAIAIGAGTFLYVGSNADADTFIGPSTRSSDLRGKLVIPGIVDGHTHAGYIGIERYGTPWLPTTSKADIVDAVRRYARAHRGNGWIRLCCWPERLFGNGRTGPNKRDLDAVVADRPVWLTSDVWHSVWVNSKALEVLGIDRNTPDPRTGLAQYVREANGEPTGWITEGAAWQFGERHFPVDGAGHEREVRKLLTHLNKHGVIALYDGGNFLHEDRVYGLLAKLERNGALPLRYEGTYQIFLPQQKADAIAGLGRLRNLYGGDRLRFNTIKLFMDGVSKSRTAAMVTPYADDSANRGNTLMSTEELSGFLIELHEARLDLHVHVLGDGAVRTVLDAVESAKGSLRGDLYPRVTLAHLGLIDPADYARFAALGVVANYTPQWHGVVNDDPMMVALGPERYARTLMVKPLLHAGAVVSFSSDDWTIDDLSPFLGMQVGHMRQFPQARRAESAAPIRGPQSERLDFETLIRGYTINGAYQLRLDNEIGSISAGKRAHFVVLDENIFTMDPADIHTIVPSAVVMDGRLLHGRLR